MRRWCVAGFLSMACFGTMQAETLLWYRFDGTGSTVENTANPGVMDGTLKSIDTWGSLAGLGETAAKFPTRVDAVFPTGTRLTIPATQTVLSGDVKGLTWSGQADDAGLVLLEKKNAAPLLDMMSFTCEFFFYLPSDVVTRTSEALFPFVTWGQDSSEGWKFSIWNKVASGDQIVPHLRARLRDANGQRVLSQSTWYPSLCVSTNTWHHLAFSVDGAGDGTPATVTFYLDYVQVYSATIENYYGFYFDPAKSFPFTIGADLYRTSKACSFMGTIAEFRLSDQALSVDELLRPRPDGPVDDTTLFYLPLGDSAWFGQKANTNDSAQTWTLSSALSAWRPHWCYPSGGGATYPPLPKAVADVPYATCRNGILDGTGFANAASIRLTRHDNAGKLGNVQHALFVADETNALQQDDFTLEFSFKQPIPMDATTNQTATLVYGNWGKICIYHQTGGLLIRPYLELGGAIEQSKYTPDGSSQEIDSARLAIGARRVDDNNWHHVAVVWEQATSNLVAYLDGQRLYAQVLMTGLQHTGFFSSTRKGFFIGCEKSVDKQGFGGFLDDVRLTRRALRPHEFLTSRLKTGTASVLFHARFENDYASGLGADIVADGTPRTINGNTSGNGEMPSFSAHPGGAKVFADAAAKEGVANAHALALAGGEVYWPRNSLLERPALTVEFFGAFGQSGHGANIIRFSPDYNPYNPKPYGAPGTPLWGIFLERKADGALKNWKVVTLACSSDEQRRLLQVDDSKTTNQLRGRRDIVLSPIPEMEDGRWHHWALTLGPTPDGNTTWTFYCDYAKIQEETVSGLLYAPIYGSVFEIGGTVNESAVLCARIDEVRISDGVLTPAAFMRRGTFATLLLVR